MTSGPSFRYTIYFTGKDDPRDGCIVIGQDERHVFFEFETAVTPYTARTTVSSDRHPVAMFDWAVHAPENHTTLGIVAVGDRELPVEQLILSSPIAGARRFHTAEGQLYEWRRAYQDDKAYELFFVSDSNPHGALPIAIYRQFAQAVPTPVGPTYGCLEYSFTDAFFLLEALITLNLNRWLDRNAR